MKLPPFELEHYLAKREFRAPYVFCSSDLETLSLTELLAFAEAEALGLWNNLKLQYTEVQGLPRLREEIARLISSSFNPENVLTFSGAEEGIFCMAHSLLEREDHVIVLTPCYQSLQSIPESICEVTTVPLSMEDQWQFDVVDLERVRKPNTKLLILNFPHNPTGTLLSHKLQQDIIEWARKHGLWIFSDEVYRLLELDDVDINPPISSVYERGMSLGVMSKAYGLAGLRIGWITCPDVHLLEKMAGLKHYLSICNSAPSEILALIALRASDAIMSRNKSIMNENLSLLDRFFERRSELFSWIRPGGGCIGFPIFHGSESIVTIADRLLEETGVLILPGRVYGAFEKNFRITFGRKTVPESIERFDDFIDSHKDRWEIVK